MCGIFGFTVNSPGQYESRELKSLLTDLLLLSESRGKEATGLAVSASKQISVLRCDSSSKKLLKSKAFDNLLGLLSLNSNDPGHAQPVSVIGHARLVTTGSQYDPMNNQPIVSSQSVGIHNGIIVNAEELWQKNNHLIRTSQVDSEVFFSLLRMFYQSSSSLNFAVKQTFDIIYGMASVAAMFEDLNVLLLASNNGSLYYCKGRSIFLFASEKNILSRLFKKHAILKNFREEDILQVHPNEACFLRLDRFDLSHFNTSEVERDVKISQICPAKSVKVVNVKAQIERNRSSVVKNVGLDNQLDQDSLDCIEELKNRFPHESSWQDSLRRCSKCVLPETMPFIHFDKEGVCNYCNHYNKLEFKGRDALDLVLSQYRKSNSEPDCVLGISGGRDSLYALHYLKAELGMNPVAYTYDWGMVTDLARRNISRFCGKLGVEHILVSADINKKRANIKKNVQAWLKKPHLGMIPLFMAGDKQYFYYLQKVKKQIGVGLAIQGENRLERTDFKTGFAGVKPFSDKQHVYTLPFTSKVKLASSYAKEYLMNISYINASILDTLFASACYYMIGRDYLNLYNYVPWIEDDVVSTLVDEYKFELASDTKTTWRIGDGTAAFYNYIYYNVAGFTENETFRSNQIREGYITREAALKNIKEENMPRYETIFWYLNMIDIDIEIPEVFEIINSVPKVSSFNDNPII